MEIIVLSCGDLFLWTWKYMDGIELLFGILILWIRLNYYLVF